MTSRLTDRPRTLSGRKGHAAHPYGTRSTRHASASARPARFDRSAGSFERRQFAQKRLFLLDRAAFASQEVGDGAAETGVG